MTNKDKELNILKAYYDMRYNNIKIDVASLNLENTHEGGYHLINLERAGYLSFEGQVLHKGGRRDEKYNNDVRGVLWSNGRITDRGETRLKEHNLIES